MNTPPRKQNSKIPAAKVPLPDSIELHNLFPRPAAAQRKKWFRPEHSTALLHNIQIEVTVVREDGKQSTIYTAIAGRRTMCPTFQHLADAIRFQDLSVELYESMKFKFTAISKEGEASSLENNNIIDACSREPHFLELNVHPKRLCRIETLPPNLPLNCCVIRFSDGSIRIHPVTYQLLLDSKQITAPKGDHRFDHSVFNALDSVTPEVSPTRTAAEEIRGNDAKLNSKTLNGISDSSNSDCVQQNGTSCKVDDDEEKGDSVLLARKNKSLQRLIKEEEAALQRETFQVEVDKELLASWVAQLRIEDEHGAEITKVLRADGAEIERTEFSLEAQRIRLIRELSTIYTISVVETDRRWLIRGLEIPAELYSGRVPEDVVSAALGFLCHTVHLMSKYLGVHLRYRLHCQSSRSAVQDERGAIFPLFQGRPVEREQLEYAFHLLDMDVECICRTRGIRLAPKLHVLAKVKRIYEHVIEGY